MTPYEIENFKQEPTDELVFTPMVFRFYPHSESKRKPKRIEEPISEEEYYRLLKLEEL